MSGQLLNRRRYVALVVFALFIAGVVGYGLLQVRQARLDASLVAAAKRGDTGAVLTALRAGADPNATEDTRRATSVWRYFLGLFGPRPHQQPGESALAFAVEYGDAAMVRALLDKRARVNVEGGDGHVPLISAATRMDSEVLRMLLGSGADVNVKNTHAYTPLMAAAMAGKAPNAELLLSRGAHVNECGLDGETPLHMAVVGGDAACIRALVAHGANARVKDNEGKTAFRYAQDQFPRVVHALRELGINE